MTSQTLLFSATYPERINSMAERFMTKPSLIKADTDHDEVSIKQYFYAIDKKTTRDEALRSLLLIQEPESALVFCNTKVQTEEVASELQEYGFSALAINGDFEQKDRTLALTQFANKSINVLVATDVAARGLDIDNIDAVINYHLAIDPEVHVHRIGRSGRAGNIGCAHSLYSDKERHKLKRLADYLKINIESTKLPNAQDAMKIPPYKTQMITLKIDAGKKQKIRAGDILGALTGENGIEGKQVGKIALFDHWACVAVSKSVAMKALKKLNNGKMKGRECRARLLQHDD